MRTITIVIEDTACGFDVQENGKTCDGLSWDEMLGQVAAMTIPPSRVGCLFAMRTPEEWAQHRESYKTNSSEVTE